MYVISLVILSPRISVYKTVLLCVRTHIKKTNSLYLHLSPTTKNGLVENVEYLP